MPINAVREQSVRLSAVYLCISSVALPLCSASVCTCQSLYMHVFIHCCFCMCVHEHGCAQHLCICVTKTVSAGIVPLLLGQNNHTFNLWLFCCAASLLSSLSRSASDASPSIKDENVSKPSVKKDCAFNSTQTNSSCCHYIRSLAGTQSHTVASLLIYDFIVSLHVYVSTEVEPRVEVLIGFL